MSSRLDEFARRHPAFATAALVVLVVLVTVLLLYHDSAPAVVYEGF